MEPAPTSAELFQGHLFKFHYLRGPESFESRARCHKPLRMPPYDKEHPWDAWGAPCPMGGVGSGAVPATSRVPTGHPAGPCGSVWQGSARSTQKTAVRKAQGLSSLRAHRIQG